MAADPVAPALPQGFVLDRQAGHGAVPPPPPGFRVDEAGAHTTLGGMAGAVSRGLAPIATGAAIGAAAGAPFAGVGAIPGAAAGAAAAGGAELIGTLYNPIAERMGWSKMVTPQQATDRLLDLFGVKRPSTGAERMAEATAGGMAGAVGPARAAASVAERATAPVVRETAARLAARPGAQAISGAAQGAAAQGAAEAGVGPTGQMAAGFLGSLLPSAGAGTHALIAITPKQAAVDAVRAGYTVPPVEAAEGGRLSPYSLTSAASAVSGKIKTGQYAAAANQPVTNRLAAESLGLGPNTLLTDRVFDQVRRNAGKAYDAIRAVPVMVSTPDYVARADALGAQARQAAAAYAAEGHPNVIPTKDIDAIRAALLSQPQRRTLDVIEFVKQMQFQAKANLASRDDPAKLALGLAQREAANMTEDMMEENLAATGDRRLLDEYREGRQLIAKSYDVESVTNVSTGDVSAMGLGRLLDKGKPLTGNLKLIADSANHFPRAFQNPAAFGGVEPLSVLDSLAAVSSAATGHLGVTAMVVGRPVARATILSHPFQRSMVSPPRPAPLPLPMLMQPGWDALVEPGGVADILRQLGAGGPL